MLRLDAGQDLTHLEGGQPFLAPVEVLARRELEQVVAVAPVGRGPLPLRRTLGDEVENPRDRSLVLQGERHGCIP